MNIRKFKIFVNGNGSYFAKEEKWWGWKVLKETTGDPIEGHTTDTVFYGTVDKLKKHIREMVGRDSETKMLAIRERESDFVEEFSVVCD